MGLVILEQMKFYETFPNVSDIASCGTVTGAGICAIVPLLTNSILEQVVCSKFVAMGGAMAASKTLPS